MVRSQRWLHVTWTCVVLHGVRRGKVRRVGTSSTWIHQFQHALHVRDREELARFETMQDLYT